MVLQEDDICKKKLIGEKVFCSGGTQDGHPIVYFTIEDKDTFCPYCGQKFDVDEK